MKSNIELTDPLLVKRIRCVKSIKYSVDGRFLYFVKGLKYNYSKFNLLGKDKVRIWDNFIFYVDINIEEFNIHFQARTKKVENPKNG